MHIAPPSARDVAALPVLQAGGFSASVDAYAWELDPDHASQRMRLWFLSLLGPQQSLKAIWARLLRGEVATLSQEALGSALFASWLNANPEPGTASPAPCVAPAATTSPSFMTPAASTAVARTSCCCRDRQRRPLVSTGGSWTAAWICRCVPSGPIGCGTAPRVWGRQWPWRRSAPSPTAAHRTRARWQPRCRPRSGSGACRTSQARRWASCLLGPPSLQPREPTAHARKMSDVRRPACGSVNMEGR